MAPFSPARVSYKIGAWIFSLLWKRQVMDWAKVIGNLLFRSFPAALDLSLGQALLEAQSVLIRFGYGVARERFVEIYARVGDDVACLEAVHSCLAISMLTAEMLSQNDWDLIRIQEVLVAIGNHAQLQAWELETVPTDLVRDPWRLNLAMFWAVVNYLVQLPPPDVQDLRAHYTRLASLAVYWAEDPPKPELHTILVDTLMARSVKPFAAIERGKPCELTEQDLEDLGIFSHTMEAASVVR